MLSDINRFDRSNTIRVCNNYLQTVYSGEEYGKLNVKDVLVKRGALETVAMLLGK